MRKRKYSTISEAEMREMASRGMTWVEIAAERNLHVEQVRAAASLHGIKSGYGRQRSVANARVLDVVARLERGERPADIATDFGVSRQAIYCALKRAGAPTTVAEAVRAKAAREA